MLSPVSDRSAQRVWTGGKRGVFGRDREVWARGARSGLRAPPGRPARAALRPFPGHSEVRLPPVLVERSETCLTDRSRWSDRALPRRLGSSRSEGGPTSSEILRPAHRPRTGMSLSWERSLGCWSRRRRQNAPRRRHAEKSFSTWPGSVPSRCGSTPDPTRLSRSGTPGGASRIPLGARHS